MSWVIAAASAGDFPAGDFPAGDFPAGDFPAGDFPAGDLPAGLADPLHLGHSPWPEVFAWLAVLGVLALLAWAYAGRRRRAAAPAPAPRPAAPAAPASGGDDALAARIRELHQRHATSLEVRAGCHRLSALTREHLERGDIWVPRSGSGSGTKNIWVPRSGHPRSGHRSGNTWVPRTAGELEARLGDEARARFFSALARLQFGRRAPNLRDWKTICDRAITVLTGPDGSTGGDP